MDGLKDINDEHGHLVGSRAVCRFAETLRAACRTTDTAARYGGDEFVAVLSDTDQKARSSWSAASPNGWRPTRIKPGPVGERRRRRLPA